MGVIVFISLFMMSFSGEEGRGVVVRIMEQNTEVLTIFILKAA